MLFTSSRLYRLPLTPQFPDPAALWAEVCATAKELGLEVAGSLFQERRRTVQGLDTVDRALASEGLALVHLTEPEGQTRLRLRLCDDDRHIASQTPVLASRGFACSSAFQEEIVPPFHSRFVHVCTVDLGQARNAELFRRSGQARVFPLVRRIAGEQALAWDRARPDEQRLFTGAYVALPSARVREIWASLALILPRGGASRGGGGGGGAELTLRVGERRERYDLSVCRAARLLQEALLGRAFCGGRAPLKRHPLVTGTPGFGDTGAR